MFELRLNRSCFHNCNIKIIYASVSIMLTAFVNAQPPCGNNPLPNDFCANATPICNLNGYCGNTSATYTSWVSSTNHTSENNTPLGNIFCASIQNNSWIKFIADSNVAVFDVWTSNCADNHGIQMQVYATTDCYNFTAVSNCWNPLTPTNGQIIATGLSVGQVYYLMIDGTQGDNCDYVIAAQTGVSTPPAITPNQSVCKGNGLNLSVSGGVSYSWTSTPNDASLAGQVNQQTITVHPLVTTTYSVTVTTQGINSFCPNSNTQLSTVVTVNQNPTIHITSSPEMCGQSNGEAIAIVTGSGGFHYSWNSTPVQTSQNAVNLYAGTYVLTVTDTNSCVSKDSVQINLIPYIIPQISGNLTFCTGTSTTLNAGNGYSTYLWNNGSTSSQITITTPGIYAVYVVDSTGCYGSDSVMVTEVPNPVPAITGDSVLCPLSHITLFVAGNYVSYLWSNGTATSYLAIQNGGNYSVIVVDSNGCKGSTSHYVFNNNGPFLTLISDNEHCYKQDGTLTVIAQGGHGLYHYLWSNGNTTSAMQNLSAGEYNVVVSDSLCVVKDSVTLVNIPAPQADFYISPPILEFLDEPVTASFFANTSGYGQSWVWDFGDGSPLFSGTNSEKHYYTTTGNYQVMLMVTDANQCVDTAWHILKVLDVFTFYVPNAFTPNGDGVNDLFAPYGTNIDPADFEMDIYNRWGELVYNTHHWSGSSAEGWNGYLNNQPSTGELQSGVYVYKIIVKGVNGKQKVYSGEVALIK